MNYGNAVRSTRKSLGMKQIPFAKKIGITQTYLSQIEGGHKEPSLDIMQKIAALSGVPMQVMIWRTIEEEDVPLNRREMFRELRPVIDNLLEIILTK